MKPTNDNWTILILARDPAKPRRFVVSRRAVRRAALAAGFAAIGLGVGVFDYVQTKMDVMVAQRREKTLLAQVRDERANAEERLTQLSALRDEVLQLRRAVNASSKLDQSLRREQGLASPAEHVIAAGGAEIQVPLADRFDDRDIERMHTAIRELIERAGIRKTSLATLSRYFRDQSAQVAQRPSLWPIKGWVTSNFGMRTSPFTGETAMHEGYDIAAPIGTVVRAPAGGTVVYVGTHDNYGNYLVIDHGGGLTTHYGHLASSLVAEGVRVSARAPIALVGNTGRSTGPHLHYEIRMMDIPVNPAPYLPEDPEDATDFAQGP